MKRKAARSLALLMAAAMTASTFYGMTIPAEAAETDKWISDDQLTDTETDAPEKDKVLPDENQYNYQKDELAAFCHFGPNTFNEVEWGEKYGDKKPDEIFKLEEDFNADLLVKSLKNAGFKKLIVTAKHHDGFCIWDSKYTDYDVANTSYKNGKGDILAEISAACTTYDMDMGLYLSPWDIHDDSYGYYDADGKPVANKDDDAEDYNEYYDNQLREILGNDEKYGNKGHFVEVWMDGAKGSGQDAQEYDFEKWFKTIQEEEGTAKDKFSSDCMLFGAQAYTTVRWIGNENGVAGTNTWSKSTVDEAKNTINSYQIKENGNNVTVGSKDGNKWTVPEADARITSGWFWGNSKNTPKSITELGNMYFNTVGHNATLLLNVPPNDRGEVDDAILNRVAEFGDNIKETFRTNLATGENASVKASQVRGNDIDYGPGKTIDGDDATYWTTDNGTNEGSLIIDLGETKRFDVVSIEEAIQNGQRIESYTVEYRNGDSDTWHKMESGETIGAKRLVRTSPVRATEIKITVSTAEGKVPMISEVGVYKASADFELTGGIPSELEQIDNIDTNSQDGSYFEYTGWTQEQGTQFSDGTSMYANKGASFKVHFTGTQIYLIGTKDPNHGTADIYIDNKKVGSIDTNASSRSLGQVIYASDTLEDKEHILELRVTGKAIGVEAAAVLNNGGAGMFEIEKSAYTMNEDSEMEITVNRVGGSKGKVTVLVSNEPGSAVQGHMDPDEKTLLTFEEGETSKKATITTKRYEDKTGDLYFTVTLTDPSGGAVLGFNDSARVTIKDTESSSLEGLKELLEAGKDRIADWYVSGWDAYAAAYAAAQEIAENPEAAQEQIEEAIANLTDAEAELHEREKYTKEDPFVFPWRNGSSATLEAEFVSEIKNDTSNDGQNGKWPCSVSENAWASNGKFLNSLNKGDAAKYYFKAEKAGTYNVTAYYRSGSGTNKLSWSSNPDNLIQAGTASAGANDNAGATHEAKFTITVNEPGSGMLVLTGPEGNSPQLDRFVITPGEIKLQKFKITATADENGMITPNGEILIDEGESKDFIITPKDGYEIADVKVDGVSVLDDVENGKYTLTNVQKSTQIVVSFKESGTEPVFEQYTEENPFKFPTEVNGEPVTLEAEKMILNNTGEAEAWELQVSEGNWASGGKYINAMNSGDSVVLYYNAEKAGIYKATLQYKSGDTKNSMIWSEANGYIAEGELSSVEADSKAEKVYTVDLTWEVKTPGAGVLTFTAGAKNAPQLDKFDIQLVEETETAAVDKTNLEAKLAEAKERAAETDVYTAESIEALNKAIAEAEAVAGADDASQEAVDNQIKLLTNAIEALEKIPAPENPDKTELGNALADANAVLAQTDKYTADSLAEYQKAVDAAQAVYDNDNATADEISEAVNALADAQKLLEEKETETPDPGTGDDQNKPGTGDDQNKPGTGDDQNKPGSGNGPDKPSAGSDKPQSGTDSGKDTVKAVQTGDDTNVTIWIVTLAAAAAAGGAAIVIRRRNTK